MSKVPDVIRGKCDQEAMGAAMAVVNTQATAFRIRMISRGNKYISVYSEKTNIACLRSQIAPFRAKFTTRNQGNFIFTA